MTSGIRLPSRFRTGSFVNQDDSKRYRLRQANAINSIRAPSKRLGRDLFFDKRLSESGNSSCATCHDPARAYAVSSIRGGHEPGTHTVLFDNPHESIRLEHVARSRDAFAAGAVAAAEWLPGRVGVYTFAQMLFGEEDA